jgi:two-component system chemotaxis sensor kinase CheA
MHSMKGSAGFLGFNHLVDVAHRGENILNKLRQAEMAVSPAIISVILETIDVIKAIMADIRESGTDNHVPRPPSRPNWTISSTAQHRARLRPGTC